MRVCVCVRGEREQCSNLIFPCIRGIIWKVKLRKFRRKKKQFMLIRFILCPHVGNIIPFNWTIWMHFYRVFSLIWNIFFFFLFHLLSLLRMAKGNRRNNRKIEFLRSADGQQTLVIDQNRYYKDGEDNFLVFWKCHQHNKSKCPAIMATMKCDKSRVVVLNDMHQHIHQPRRTPIKKR